MCLDKLLWLVPRKVACTSKYRLIEVCYSEAERKEELFEVR